MERSNYEGAIESFKHARAQMRHYGDRLLVVISLVSFLMGVLQCIESAHRLTAVRMEI
jgi:hypothetical protein